MHQVLSTTKSQFCSTQPPWQVCAPTSTAVAKVANNKVVSGWLVPTNAITLSNGKATITLVRNGTQQQVEVTTGDIQGEWTVVESPRIAEWATQWSAA